MCESGDWDRWKSLRASFPQVANGNKEGSVNGWRERQRGRMCEEGIAVH